MIIIFGVIRLCYFFLIIEGWYCINVNACEKFNEELYFFLDFVDYINYYVNNYYLLDR